MEAYDCSQASGLTAPSDVHASLARGSRGRAAADLGHLRSWARGAKGSDDRIPRGSVASGSDRREIGEASRAGVPCDASCSEVHPGASGG